MTDGGTCPIRPTTIALIGGPMTLDDGSWLDSRQPLEGDPDSEVTLRALATSWLWWDTASSLVLPILDAVGSAAFALVLGQRSVVDLRSDGEIQRSRLSRLLPGGVGTISVIRTSMDEQLPAGYDLVTVLRSWNGESLGTVGIKQDQSRRRWRFVDGFPYLHYTVQPIGASVIVDTNPRVASMEGIETMGTERFQALESELLSVEGVVVVMPHTHATEKFIREYLSWLQKGRKDIQTSLERDVPSWDPAQPPNPVRYMHPVPVAAEFQVTGLVQGGQWQDPSELEAARSLLRARYDLKIGIWDLVENPTLRRTLLETVPTPTPPDRLAAVPPGAGQRATIAVGARLEARTALETARLQLLKLKDVGWSDSRYSYEVLHLPLTEPVPLWPEELEREPLLWLTLAVLKRQTQISVWSSMHGQVDLTGYIESHHTELKAVAGSNLGDLSKGWPTIWQAKGGWADSVNWPSRAMDVATLTPSWTAVFEDLAATCRHVWAQRFSGSGL